MFRDAAPDGTPDRTAGERRVWARAFRAEPDAVRRDEAQVSEQVWKAGGLPVWEPELRDEPDVDLRDGEQAEAQVWMDEERRVWAQGRPDEPGAERNRRDAASEVSRDDDPAEAAQPPLHGEAAGPSNRQSSYLPENRETCVYSYFHLVPVYGGMAPFQVNIAQRHRPARVSVEKHDSRLRIHVK